MIHSKIRQIILCQEKNIVEFVKLEKI